MKLVCLAFLFSVFTYSKSQSCTVNTDCPVQGECCAASSMTCITTYTCVSSDGLKGMTVDCSSNSECATGCCNDFWKKCLSYSCMDDPQGLTGKGIFVIILAIIATIVIIMVFCIGYRKMNKQKEQSQNKY